MLFRSSYRTGTGSGGSSGSSRSSSGSYEPAAAYSAEALAATPAVQNLRDTINEGVNILGLNSLQSLPLSSGNWGTTGTNNKEQNFFPAESVPGARSEAEQEVRDVIVDSSLSNSQKAEKAQQILDGHAKAGLLSEADYNYLISRW